MLHITVVVFCCKQCHILVSYSPFVLLENIDSNCKVTFNQEMFLCHFRYRPPFKSAVHLLTHMIRSHAPLEGKTSICKVPGCATPTKPRGALICHFQEKHCLTKNEDGTSTVVPVPNHLYSKYKEVRFLCFYHLHAIQARVCSMFFYLFSTFHR